MAHKKHTTDIKMLFEKGTIKFDIDLKMLPLGTKELFVAKNYTQCLRRCNATLRKNPDNIAALFYKAIILQDRKKHIESNDCLDIFLNQFSTFYIAYQYQTENYLALGQYEDAYNSTQQHLRINSDNDYIWGFLGISTYLKGREELAYMLLEEAERHVTGSKKILYLITGLLKEKEGKNDEAVMHLIKYQKDSKDPNEDMSEKIYKLLL